MSSSTANPSSMTWSSIFAENLDGFATTDNGWVQVDEF